MKRQGKDGSSIGVATCGSLNKKPVRDYSVRGTEAEHELPRVSQPLVKRRSDVFGGFINGRQMSGERRPPPLIAIRWKQSVKIYRKHKRRMTMLEG
jgi:hypothetical protein